MFRFDIDTASTPQEPLQRCEMLPEQLSAYFPESSKGDDPAQTQALSYLRKASELARSHAANQFPCPQPLDSAETLALMKEARKFQQKRIVPMCGDCPSPTRSPLKLKIIKKRSRKLSKTSKTDSVATMDSWEEAPDRRPGEDKHVAEFTLEEVPEIRHTDSRSSSLLEEEEVGADYLGIERLIY